MALANLVQAQQYVLQKLVWVCRHKLAEAIDEFNAVSGLTGPDQLQFPRTINTNNSIFMYPGSPSIDGFPAVNLFEASHDIKIMDSLQSRDHRIVINVTAAEMCDSADIDFAVNRARLLSSLLSGLLEEFMRDPTVQPDTTPSSVQYGIYRCDTINGAAGGVQPLKGNNMFVTAFSTQIEISMRSRYDDSETIMRNNDLATPFVPAPFVGSLFYPGSVLIDFDVAPLGDVANNNSYSNVNYTAGEFASSAAVVITAGNMLSNTPLYATNQRTGESVRVLISGTGGTFTIPFSSLSPVDGDTWTLDAIDPVTKTACSYTINWNVV